MIPQSFIQDLLARVDIVDVVGRYVQLKKGGQNFLGLCPFHGEKSPSFTVSPSKQFYHCFGCGAHGSAIGFLMEHRGLGYVEAIRELAQQAGLQVPESAERNSDASSKVRALTDLLKQAEDYYRGQLKDSPAAIEYLKGRGLTGATAARFGLGYAPDAWQPLRAAVANYDDSRLVEAGLVIADEGKRYDRFRGRIMFPIRNPRGQVIGFGARILGAGEPKYLNSPETPVFRKGQELYGLHEARDAIRQSDRAIVCEGYLDVIQLSQAGFAEAVAALGTAVTSAHVSALLRATDHVIFAFDGDAAGRKAARRALEATLPVIADTKRASFVLLPEGEDPDSLVQARGAAAFEAELTRALPLSRFFIETLASGRSLGSPEDRAAIVAEAKPLLLSMPPGRFACSCCANWPTRPGRRSRTWRRCTESGGHGRVAQLSCSAEHRTPRWRISSGGSCSNCSLTRRWHASSSSRWSMSTWGARTGSIRRSARSGRLPRSRPRRPVPS